MASEFQSPEPSLEAAPKIAAAQDAAERATYTLRYEEDALGIDKRIEFEAASPAYALEIAGAEAEGRRALLLENGRPICALVKAAAGDAPLWIIASRR